MPRFRILHASDCHFSTRPFRIGLPETLGMLATGRYLRFNHAVSTHSPTVALAFAAFAYHYRNTYDVAVLSGDLGATGSNADLSAAHTFLTAAPAPGRPLYAASPTQGTLSFLGKRVVLLPGNHDRYGPLLAQPPYSPGETTFDGLFGHAWHAGQGAQELWRRTKDGTPLVLLGADFTLRAGDLGVSPVTFVSALGNWASLGHYGQGRVCDGPLRELEQLTEKVRAECGASVVVWVIHFEPQTPSRWLQLLDDGPFVQAAAKERIPAILCGHPHRSLIKPLGGGASAYGCGTTTQFFVAPPDTNCLHILEIDSVADPAAPPSILCRRYAYDPVQKRFLRDQNFP